MTHEEIRENVQAHVLLPNLVCTTNIENGADSIECIYHADW